MAWTLNDTERERLNCFPTDISSEEIITYFTFTPADKKQIPITSGASNRLGFALQLCTLRYLGFCPDKLTPVPVEVLEYLAKQLAIAPDSLSDYGERAHTRTDHLQAIQEYWGFHKATQADFTSLAAWLLDRTLEHDKPSLLLQLLCEKFYQEKIVRPGITRLEKMVATARSQAQEETFKRVSPLLTPEHKKFLDDLLVSDEVTNRTHHAWLIKGATSNTASAMLFCLDKLAFLRKQEINTWDMSLLTPNRLRFLSQIAKRSTNQAVQRMSEEKRYPILLAFLNQSLFEITDETIEIFDRCLWDCYNGAKNDLEAFKKEVYKSSNEKLILLKEVGKLVLDPEIKDPELRESIFAYLPQEKLKEIIEECSKIIRPTNDKYFDFLSTRYSYLQQFVPKFLDSFAFQSNTKDDVLLAAIDTLRQMNANNQRKLPNDAPLDFLPDDWTQYVIDRDGKVNKRYYTLSGLWELRSNLRAGNVWVANSRRYANPETYLIPKDKWEQLRTEVCKQMNVQENGFERLQEKKQELAILLKSADTFLANKGEVRIENGKLVMPRLKEEELPESARKLQELITARLPRIELTDLFIEVGGWVNLPEPFDHAGGSQSRSPELPLYLYASTLAQAENFGLHQMRTLLTSRMRN